MASLNSCSFTGRLGRDPELRSTPSGRSVCSFPLAVDGFGRDAETLWLDVSVWGRAGENVAQYLSKGREVAVTGRVGLRLYEKRDGSTGASVTLDAQDAAFIGGRGDGGPARTGASDIPGDAAPAPAQAQAFNGDDDIPF